MEGSAVPIEAGCSSRGGCLAHALIFTERTADSQVAEPVVLSVRTAAGEAGRGATDRTAGHLRPRRFECADSTTRHLYFPLQQQQQAAAHTLTQRLRNGGGALHIYAATHGQAALLAGRAAADRHVAADCRADRGQWVEDAAAGRERSRDAAPTHL